MDISPNFFRDLVCQAEVKHLLHDVFFVCWYREWISWDEFQRLILNFRNEGMTLCPNCEPMRKPRGRCQNCRFCQNHGFARFHSKMKSYMDAINLNDYIITRWIVKQNTGCDWMTGANTSSMFSCTVSTREEFKTLVRRAGVSIFLNVKHWYDCKSNLVVGDATRNAVPPPVFGVPLHHQKLSFHHLERSTLYFLVSWFSGKSLTLLLPDVRF